MTQGRNLAGREGIFPKDYTTPAGPLLPDIRTPTGTSSFNTGVPGGGGSVPQSNSGFHSGGYGGTLHPLTEENESDSAIGPAGMRIGSNQEKGGRMMAATMTEVQQAIDQLGVHRSNSALTDDGRSMSFASTRDDRTSVDDHDRGYNDDGRSVRESLYDDGTIVGRERMTMNEDWHRDARRRLFERVDQMDEAARRAQEEQEHDEREYHRPPVDVEFSDESEDEDHHNHHHHQQEVPNDLLHRLQPQHDDSIPSTIPSTFQGDHSNAGRDDDGGDADVSNATAGQAGRITDSPAKADSPTLAPSRTTTLDTPVSDPSTTYLEPEPNDARAITPVQEPPAQKVDANPEYKTTGAYAAPNGIKESSSSGDDFLPVIAPTSPFAPSPFAPSTPGTANSSHMPGTGYPISSSAIYPSQSQSQLEQQSSPQQAEAAKPSIPASSSSYVSFLPSPTAATFNTAPSGNTLSSQAMSTAPTSDSRTLVKDASSPALTSTTTGDASNTSYGHANGAASIISSMTSTSLAPPTIPPSITSPNSNATSKKKVPPAEWTVEQVVEWIRGKGFDEGVCGKFVEHEITGDVLIEMDVNMLKEIDIIAFGKRMKIANAISELRRPPSFESSDAVSLNPSQFSVAGAHSAPQSTTAPNFLPIASMSMPHLAGLPNHGHSMSHSTQGGYTASISSAPSVQSPSIFGMLHTQQQQAAAAAQTQNLNGGYSPNPYVMVSSEHSGGYSPAIGMADQRVSCLVSAVL